MARVKQYKKDYAGTERSPYWDYLSRRGDYNQEHDANEPAEANPDALAETSSAYYQDTETAVNSEQYELVLAVLPLLTMRQREILRITGYEGRSYEECAGILGISKSTVQKTIERIRERIGSEKLT